MKNPAPIETEFEESDDGIKVRLELDFARIITHVQEVTMLSQSGRGRCAEDDSLLIEPSSERRNQHHPAALF
jgi:hypothetical protein